MVRGNSKKENRNSHKKYDLFSSDNVIYKIPKEDLINNLNEKFPIKLTKDNEKLIDNIHDKIPHIEKEKIVEILKEFFQLYRDFMILGDTICIPKFLRFAHTFIKEVPVFGNILYSFGITTGRPFIELKKYTRFKAKERNKKRGTSRKSPNPNAGKAND